MHKNTKTLTPAISIWPKELNLSAVNKIYAVNYLPMILTGKTRSVKARENSQGELLIFGQIDHKLQISNALLTFIRQCAKTEILPWLKHISLKIGLDYHHAAIRYAARRWGSCSSKKHISLNAKLLFLPHILVEHVLIHELCHTVHLNHSKRFWRLFQKFNPDCLALRQQLRQAAHTLPAWLEIK